jgi:5-methylcytosine-specific restriction endonuclease McrA
MPKKTNNYKISDDDFIAAVKSSISIRETLLKLGLVETGSAYRVFKNRIAAMNLDTSHLLGNGYLKDRTHNWTPSIPLEEILVKDSLYHNTNSLRKKLIRKGHLQNRCLECENGNTWNGKPITLQLDHINGDSSDNRLINLRILCPNCHSQTKTFAGRNKGGANGGT